MKNRTIILLGYLFTFAVMIFSCTNGKSLFISILGLVAGGILLLALSALYSKTQG